MGRGTAHGTHIQGSRGSCGVLFIQAVVGVIVVALMSLAQVAAICQTARWRVLAAPGASAMHMTVTRFNKVIVFDSTRFAPSKLPLPPWRCSKNPRNVLDVKRDCTAHSYEFDPSSNTYRPLFLFSDTLCSSGAFTSNGTLLQTGGGLDGNSDMVIRSFAPCNNNSCEWLENGRLLSSRWYASNQLLPDDRVIVVGGRGSFSYEFVPRTKGTLTSIALPLLQQTNVPNIENNLYPFLHLSSDGNLFIFANTQSILLDYKTNKVVRTYPVLSGGSRSYPSSGSSVMLPLQHTDNFKRVEVMICGGSVDGAYEAALSKRYLTALRDCARMVITDAAPQWVREDMPQPRVMSDMLILPTGDILIINGAQQGTSGWDLAETPSLTPFLYNPLKAAGRRFHVLAGSTIPRMYHSTAVVLHDGRVLVGGSNTHIAYRFEGVAFPTELRLESMSPYYLNAGYDEQRPTITAVSAVAHICYGSQFTVSFTVPSGVATNVQFNIYYPPFNTHSFSMSQRMLFLAVTSFSRRGSTYLASIVAPPSPVAAPSSYYMLRVINNGIPSNATWVRFA